MLNARAILLSLATLCLPGSFGVAQDIPKETPEIFQKVNATQFPVVPNGDWWLYGSGGNENYLAFVYEKDVDTHARTVSVWIRIYDFQDNSCNVQRVKLDRNRNKFMVINFNVYRLNTGKLFQTSGPSYVQFWDEAPPGTFGETLFHMIDLFEYKVKQTKK